MTLLYNVTSKRNEMIERLGLVQFGNLTKLFIFIGKSRSCKLAGGSYSIMLLLMVSNSNGRGLTLKGYISYSIITLHAFPLPCNTHKSREKNANPFYFVVLFFFFNSMVVRFTHIKGREVACPKFALMSMQVDISTTIN